MYKPSDFKVKDHPEIDKFKAFHKWIESNCKDSEVSKINLFYFAENYRGVCAT